MLPNRLTIKFLSDDLAAVTPLTFVSVFQGWIRDRALPGVLIDVANYGHVWQGPGVLLAGHERDYGIDQTYGRSGLLVTGKRGWAADTLTGRVQETLTAAAQAAHLLQTAVPTHPLTFQTNEIEIGLLDRLHTPNDAATFAAVSPPIQTALTALTPDTTVHLAVLDADPRQPLRVRATLSPAPILLAWAGEMIK